MSKKCDCCGKRLGIFGVFSVKDGTICGKCYKRYTGTGRTFKKKLTIDEISDVVQEEGQSVEVKPFFFELVDSVFGGVVSSRKRSIKWGIACIVIGIIVIPVFTGDMVKYLRDGAEADFYLVDEEKKWIDSTTNEITERYEAEVDGQIIRYSHSYKEYHELGNDDRITGREDNGVDSRSLDGTIKVYRENGEWHLAEDAMMKDFLLLIWFPIFMFILGGYFISCFVKLKKNEKII